MTQQTVGVIGVGNMGAGIARNIARKGHAVVAWDAVPAARDRIAGEPGIVVAPPAEIARRCAAILFVVPSSKEIAACLEGPDGILANAAPGLLLCDLTTADPADTRKLGDRAAAHGVAYIDAAMSGGATGADAGTLTLMVGGDAAQLAKVQAVFDTFAKNVFHLGPLGAGHTMKLVHNMVTHTIFFATCEGARVAAGAGISVADMIKVFNVSNARSYASEVRFPRHILSGTWDARSRVYNLHKDLKMAVGMAGDLDVPVGFGAHSLALLEAAMAEGLADTDYSRLYEVYDRLTAAGGD
ncbi:MAG: NAD(P)-dependent oxidoreductase [Alphaproteobacteria bacterium]